MGLLTRDQILAASDMETRTVEVPEWGGTVRVRSITADERDQFEEAMVPESRGRGRKRKTAKASLIHFRARLVALATVDDGGARLFSDEDVEKLGQKSAGALSRVFDAAAELAGLTAEEVEEIERNLTNDRSGASS